MRFSANVPFAAALADALSRLGVTDVCLSPGSRNTPLTLAFAAHDGLRDWIHHDERSAGFFALGLARASGRAVAIVSTSGTAAAEYHPAVVEAALSRVPLLVLTADRPPELRDVGAPQTIDQIKLYGDAVKWFHHGAPPGPAEVAHAPHLAAHAWGTAMEPPAGPVHLNLAFREPLLDAMPSMTVPATPPVVATGAAAPDSATIGQVGDLIAGRRTLFVAGLVPTGAAEEIDRLAAAVNAVVVADPQSGLRSGSPTATVLSSGDLLAAAGALDVDPPAVVVRWGALPTSKPVWRWLEDHPETPQILIDAGAHRDPLASASMIVRSDPALTAAALGEPAPGPQDWVVRWAQWDHDATAAVAKSLRTVPFPNEPQIARTVVAAAPDGSALFAGSSMPIRDVDAFAARAASGVDIFANRGANGIDGSLSTALGIAASGRPAIALVGDVAALHDVGALATAARLDLPLTVVVVHNDGGGIFHLLPQADPGHVDPAVFERTFGTPHGTDFVAVAGAFGLAARRLGSAEELHQAIAGNQGPQLLELRTSRAEIAPLRRRIVSAVRDALSPPRPELAS